jgi:two-component system, OmpR family, sensor kinase
VVATVMVSAQHRFGPHGLGRPLLFVTVVLLAVAVATRPLSRRLSRPLERLTAAARQLGGGDLGTRAPLPPRRGRWWRRHTPADEIVQLTVAFNDMAERVERLVRGQKELLANVSHELRSPLARIRVALALLPQDEETGRRVRAVEADLAELDRLIEDVLTTARLDATGLPVHLAPVDPNELVSQVAERATSDPLMRDRDVRVVTAPPGTLIADASLLRRALSNLVDNAAKYGAPPITLAVIRQGDRVELVVTDQGPGIPPEERERVTEPFYRGDRARTPGAAGEPRGVGLGLTLAKRVAEVHDGRLTIGPASIVTGQERGCRVAITLPTPTSRPADRPPPAV